MKNILQISVVLGALFAFQSPAQADPCPAFQQSLEQLEALMKGTETTEGVSQQAPATIVISGTYGYRQSPAPQRPLLRPTPTPVQFPADILTPMPRF